MRLPPPKAVGAEARIEARIATRLGPYRVPEDLGADLPKVSTLEEAMALVLGLKGELAPGGAAKRTSLDEARHPHRQYVMHM